LRGFKAIVPVIPCRHGAYRAIRGLADGNGSTLREIDAHPRRYGHDEVTEIGRAGLKPRGLHRAVSGFALFPPMGLRATIVSPPGSGAD
jgi:hypothetical protein